MANADHSSPTATLPLPAAGPAPAREQFQNQTGYLGLRVAGLVCGLVLLFRFNLIRLWGKTNPFNGDPDWGHAVFIPLVGLAYLWTRRTDLERTPINPSAWGLVPLVGGIAAFTYGIGMYRTYPGLSDFVQDTGMVMAVFGTVLAVLGRRVMTIAWFPILYLFCAIPWPPSFHDQITAPLQHFAATASVALLQCTGMNVEQSGNRIVIYAMSGQPRILEVAEACSGLRSLVTLIAVGGAVAFLSSRPLSRQILIAVLAVPVAILTNIVRIFGQGLLDHYVSQKASEGFYHQCVGMVMIGMGLVLLLAAAWLVDHLFVATADAPRKHRLRPPPNAPARKLELRAALSGRVYFAALAVVAVSAVGMNAAAGALQLHFQKIPVPLRHPLTDLAADLGPWHQIGEDTPVEEIVEEKLGTHVYIFRDYLDERLVGRKVIDLLRAKPVTDRQAALASIRAQTPAALVSFGVTYYTGKVDSVTHIPERCYVMAGTAAASADSVVTWPLPDRSLATRFVRFDGRSAAGSWAVNVAYFYQVNGRYETEPWQVRRSLMNIFEKYTYYAKFELTTWIPDRAESERVMADFAGAAVPQAENCLPGKTPSKPQP